MNTKTKTKINLKRALLFFIPFCLIVGMLAVPAFADVTWPSVSGNVTPIDFTYSGVDGDEQVNTDGYYLITFSMQDLRTALGYVGSYNNGSTYTLRVFGTVDFASYTRVVTSTADEYFYKNYIAGPNDDYFLNFRFTGGSEDLVMNVPNGVLQQTYDLNSLTAPEQISFIVTEYPPTTFNDEQTDIFWENLNYTVQEYAVSTEPPAGDDDGGEGDTSGIFAVWSEITDWIINGLTSATNAFYYNGQLTLLGYLCIIPLALGVALLLISIVQKFLHLRG